MGVLKTLSEYYKKTTHEDKFAFLKQTKQWKHNENLVTHTKDTPYKKSQKSNRSTRDR